MSTPVNGLNITQTGLVKFDGTSAFTSTTTTQYNVLVGNTANAIANVAPSATSGVPLISQGNAANPAFGTAVVAGGGTGIVSTTAYAPICAGTTATGNFQQATTGFSTSGFVLTSNGSSALPSFQAVTSGPSSFQIVTQVFTGNGTYTPTSGMKFCIVEVVGGGGGGGGSATTTGTQVSGGGGGGSGGYSKETISAATIGASQTVTIGGGGNGGAAGNNSGSTGGTTSLGSLIQATGGVGGGGGAAGISISSTPGTPGVGSLGDLNCNGAPGIAGFGVGIASYVLALGGAGGSSIYGGGAEAQVTGSPGAKAGIAGRNYGSGGGGGVCAGTGTQQAGGAGSAGVVVITEYVLVASTIVTTLPWTEVTSATQALAVNNGYVTNRGGGVTYTLPASGAVGDVIRISGKSGISTVNQNANQQIVLASASTTVGITGSIASTNTGDCIELICTTGGTSTVWRANGQIGVWSVT